MKATLLKRYDENGAFTHDFDVRLGEYTPDKDSMWRVAGYIDVDLDKEYTDEDVDSALQFDDELSLIYSELNEAKKRIINTMKMITDIQQGIHDELTKNEKR